MCRVRRRIVLPAVKPRAEGAAFKSAAPSSTVKPTVKRLPTVKPSRTAALEKKPAKTQPKSFPRQLPPLEKKLTLRGLLDTELENTKSWCPGFAHGTHYDAFLGMIQSEHPAILPYAELPTNLQRSGRRNKWKKEGVFFRIVRRPTKIIDSLGSTGASGGVVLFMPLDKSLNFKLYSLSGSDTQLCNSPVIPKREVFVGLKKSQNLTMAEIAFGERISFSYITKIFLLTNKAEDKEATAVSWLFENGFCEEESFRNSRGTYRQFVRQSSVSSPRSLPALRSY